VLSNQPESNPDSIERAMNRRSELRVRVESAVHVFIGYFTAWVDALGLVHFRNDIYGHDKKMLSSLFER
jgi:L,D-transpeptidase YcbB